VLGMVVAAALVPGFTFVGFRAGAARRDYLLLVVGGAWFLSLTPVVLGVVGPILWVNSLWPLMTAAWVGSRLAVAWLPSPQDEQPSGCEGESAAPSAQDEVGDGVQ